MPRAAAMSLKSVAPGGRSGPKSGVANNPPTARAASFAFVSPGLPKVAASSSAQTINGRVGKRARIPCATAFRFPALNATATGWPVAWWMVEPVAKPSAMHKAIAPCVPPMLK